MRTRPLRKALLPCLAALLALPSVPSTAERVQQDVPEASPVPADSQNVSQSEPASTNARRRRTGWMDRSFGTEGLVRQSFPLEQYGYPADIVVQPDGRILIGGGSVDGARILRYDLAGTLDTTFGDNGTVIFGPEVDGSVIAMAVRPDGKIVVAGRRTGGFFTSLDWYRYVTRLNPDGSLDTSFGTSGFTVVGLVGANDNDLFDLALQPDGKIVVGGRRWPSDFYLVRLNEDGSPDTGFGAGGELTTTFPTGDSGIASILLRPDGKILAVGSTTHSIGIARYEPDGSLDSGFGQGGLVVSNILEKAAWAGLEPDGSIVVASLWRDIPYPYSDMAVTRFLSDGTLDTAFGENGRARIDFEKNTEWVSAGAIQSDGKILVGGMTLLFDSSTFHQAVGVARLDLNGKLDKGFGHGGLLTIEPGGTQPDVAAMAMQPDGRIVLGGWATPSTWFLARLLP
jgi:uncharacterized delta-60 repeat protein